MNREPADELGRALKATTAAMRRLRGRESHRHDELTGAQYSLLFGLREHPSLSARELAEAADLAPATAAEMLEALAVAGLVERVRSDRDRRVVLTSLTERGRELVEEHRARYEPRWLDALAEFSDGELATAAAVLDRLAALFDSLAEERLEPAAGTGERLEPAARGGERLEPASRGGERLEPASRGGERR